MASADYLEGLIEPINDNEKNFRNRMSMNTRLMNIIEDDNLKEYTMQCIPSMSLTIKATQMLSTVEEEYCLEDCLTIELLHWFKLSFFSWVDVPECPKCSKPTQYKNTVTPTSDELMWLASTVELYFCEPCQTHTRFPRYVHPKKLLETRKGRCGEWVSCFALISRAFNIDTRFVTDWNDHVWIEMYSPSKQKWIHCDPCEKIYNQPLMYEIGWKKDMLFVLAFSKDEVQDVTWRYTQKFATVQKKRRDSNIRESFILALINYHTQKCRSNVDLERLNFLQKRQALELAEFLSPPKASSETLGGRTSGSLAWRLARRETSADSLQNSYIFNLNPNEIANKHFHIQYSCALDKYVRVSDNSTETKNWSSLAFKSENVFRKIEKDWKMSYLVRPEESIKGMIMWKFEFAESGLIVERLKLKLQGRTFHSGKVRWQITPVKSSGLHAEKVYTTPDLNLVTNGCEDFKGATGLAIMAEVSGGDGNQAWQHAQIFRQELSSNEFPFELEIFFVNMTK